MNYSEEVKMTYVCNLGTGQQIFLNNQTTHTIVTIASTQSGQQQQASSSFQTGIWTAPPQAFQSAAGILIKIQSTQGEHHIQIQGNQIQIGSFPISEPGQALPMQQIDQNSTPPEIQPMQPMKPMEPMQPMQPMRMGNMSMSMNPMKIQMGNMELEMKTAAPTTPKFCSQCGTAVKPDDRFCASCGSRLISG
jgi:hypothetical protein